MSSALPSQSEPVLPKRAAHYLWAVHFMAHYHSLTHVLCFLLFNLWLLPFGFFISLSINESTLPDRQAQGADEVYSDGGAVALHVTQLLVKSRSEL